MSGREELLALVRSLRATRSFRADEIAPELLDELIDVARWTGSARNRQPWRVVVVTDAALRARLSAFGAYAAHLASAPAVLVLGVDVESGADAEFDAGRFAQSLMLAAHANGLASCPVTFFGDGNVAAATRLAGLHAPWRARTAIAVGYAAPSPFAPGTRSAVPRGRLPLETLRRAQPAQGPTPPTRSTS